MELLRIILSIATATLLVAVLFCFLLYRRCREYRARVNSISAYGERLTARLRELERRNQQAELQQEWYHSLLDHCDAMVLVCSLNSEGLPQDFVDVNTVACRELDYDRQRLLATSPLEIEVADMPLMMPGYSKTDLVVLSDDYVREQQHRIATNIFRNRMRQVIAEGRSFYETTFRTRTGKTLPVEVELHLSELAGQQLMIQTARNIAKRLVAEQALQDSQKAFRDFFAYSPIGIIMYNAERKLREVNPACLRIFGVPTPEEFARFNVFDNPFIPPKIKAKLAKGESVRFEMTVDFETALRQSLFVTTRQGRAHFDVLINSVVLDKEYRPNMYFVQVLDVTDQRRTEMELRERDQQLRQAEKMEALGSIAGGIAHDFNNILTPLLGYANMILRSHAEEDTSHQHAGRILKAARRAKELVAQILTFSRKTDDRDEDNKRPVHVIPIVKEVLVLQGMSLPQGVEIKRILKTENDVVTADATKLHQVFMNLCTNACHAMRDTGGGVLEVAVSDFMLDARSKARHRDLQPGRYLQVSVRDTGTGIEPAIMSRIFEPFFTTKPKGEGTGMGLAVTYGIVKSCGGDIHVDSTVGKGTVFHVLLPICERAAEHDKSIVSKDLPTGTESILVVDEDADALETEKQMLASLGYKPTGVGRSTDALRLFRQDPSSFDIVITSYNMAGATGIAVAKNCLGLRPDVPVVLCVGQNEHVPMEKAREIGLDVFLTKPVEMEPLATIVRSELDRARILGESTRQEPKAEKGP